MIHPKVRNKVPDSHVSPAEAIAEISQGTDNKEKANIGENDELGVFGIENRASGIKVIHLTIETVLLAFASTLALAVVIVVSRNVGDEVSWPSEELLDEQVQSGVYGRLLTKLAEIFDRTANFSGMLLACSGNVNHVTLHVASSLVVGTVGKLPAEIRYEKSRVKDPASDVADEARIREGAVTAFMSKDPNSCSEETLQDSIDTPEDESGRSRRNGLGRHVVVEQIEGGRKKGNVAEDVPVASKGRAFKAMLGDGITDILDGVIRRCEGVSVSIEQAGVLVFLVVDIEGRK